MVAGHFPFSLRGPGRMNESARVAIVTGASSGIGWALAKELAREGYAVGLLARRREPLEQLANEIRASGGQAEFEPADIIDRIATLEAIHRLCERLGPADLLAACAGAGVETNIEPMNVEDVERMMRVNLFGVVYAIEAVLPDMLKRGRGHVAAVASLAAYKGFPGQGGYCASKAAVKIYLESLRMQLRGRGIDVTCICPGFVKTPMTDAHPFRMPFLMGPEDAARRIARALRKKTKVFNFPWAMSRLVKFTYWVPDWIMVRIARGTYR
jgi:short-subunit dehydrogenase